MVQLRTKTGFTLMELLVVVSIVAILATLAYPSYSGAAERSKRTAIKFTLLDLHLRQQQFHLLNGTYAEASELGMQGSDFYTLSIKRVTSTTFELVAEANGEWANEQPCKVLTIDESMRKSPHGCW